MAIAKVYGLGMQSFYSKEVNFATDTVKVMLCSSGYTPDQDAHRYKSSVTNEVSGTGYTARGLTLTSKTLSYDSPSNTLTLDAADPTWTATTLSGVHYAVFYVDTGSDGTSPLISYMDFQSDYATTAQDFTIVLPATGIVQATAA